MRLPNFTNQAIQGTGVGAVLARKNLTVDVVAGYALKIILPDQDHYRIDARAELSFQPVRPPAFPARSPPRLATG